MQVISLGGGVQSTALFLMNLQGEIDPPADFAIFADTGWERHDTYKNISRINTEGLNRGFPPIWKVSTGNIRQEMLQSGDRHYGHIPFFTRSFFKTGQLNLDGSDDIRKGTGQLHRQCTNYYKIRPINAAIREEYGMKPRTQWIGFSVDELVRMRPSRIKYITLRFPLIEKRMDRADCVHWLLSHGYPVPVKSSCIGCPYHTDAEWKSLDAAEWEDACLFDEEIRDKHDARRHNFKLYLHRTLIPLRELINPKSTENLDRDEECSGGCWL